MRQAIIWTNYALLYWRMYVSLEQQYISWYMCFVVIVVVVVVVVVIL